MQIEENGSYTMAQDDGCQLVANRYTNGIPSIDKDSIDKDRLGEDSKESVDLDKAMDEFVKFRKAMKKPMTDRAKELILKDLQKMAPDDIEKQIAIINQSIKRGWVGVFPLKEEAPKAEPKQENRNFKVSNDPDKWNNDSFKNAIGDLLNG